MFNKYGAEHLNSETLQKYLNERIPISKAMEIKVLEAGPKQVIISAPLMPNVNHINTVFGGSASAVSMLSAWSLLYIRLANEDIKSNIVINKTHVTFERPIMDTFTSVTMFDDDTAWGKFVLKLKSEKKAGLNLHSTLMCNGSEVGKLEGYFVSYF